MIRVLAVVAALAFGWTVAAPATPLDLKQVAGEAVWVTHLDVDVMHASEAVGKVFERFLDSNDEVRHRAKLLRRDLGFNLTTGAHGVTVYGTRFGKHEGVFLIQADFDQAAFTAKIARAADHKSSTYRDCELHSWTSIGRGKHPHALAGSFYRPTLFVLASNTEELKAAIEVLDKRSPNLSGKSSPLAVSVMDGAMLIVRAVGLYNAELPYKSPFVTQSEAFHLAVAESHGELTIKAELTLKSAEIAAQVKSILDGLRAMAELRGKEDPKAFIIAKTIHTTIHDKTVLVQCRATPDQLLQQARSTLKKSQAASEPRSHRNGNPEK